MDIESNIRAELAREKERTQKSSGEEEYSLQKLYYWLKYEGLSSLFVFSAFFIPYRLVVTILTVAAVVFTPFLLWHLAKAEWYRAITLFVAFVGLPFILSRLLPDGLDLGQYLLSMTPLVAFYVFNWVLRLIIGEYLSDLQATRDVEFSRRNR